MSIHLASASPRKKVSCRFNYRIVKPLEGGREQLLVRGFTVHACVDRQGRLAPIPEDACRAMAVLCGDGEDQR